MFSASTLAAPLPVEVPLPQPVSALADIAMTSAVDSNFVVFFFIVLSFSLETIQTCITGELTLAFN